MLTAIVAGSWLIASVWSDLTTASWSTTFAVQGKSSLTQVPLCPCLRELEEAGGDREALLAGGHGGQALVAAHGSRQLLAEHLP